MITRYQQEMSLIGEEQKIKIEILRQQLSKKYSTAIEVACFL